MTTERPPRSGRARLTTLLVGCAAVVGLLLCLLTLGLAYLLITEAEPVALTATPTALALATAAPTVSAMPPTLDVPSATPTVAMPTPTVVTPTSLPSTATPRADSPPTPTPSAAGVPAALAQTPADALALAALVALWQDDPPPYDYYEVARSLGYEVGARTVAPPLPQIGDAREFSIDEQRLTAELVAQGEYASLWAEVGYDGDAATFAAVAAQIDRAIYPRLRDLFGEEWRPGVDGDPRFHLLHVISVENFAEIGFFNSVNQYPRTLDANSNEQELLFLNMQELSPGSDLYYATVAHELVHLIQWHRDPNEEVWLDEGLGQLAELVLGYETADTLDYMNNPQTSLTAWGYDDAVVYDHYGASFLFAAYLWEQLGDEAIRELMALPYNGLVAVRQLLARQRPQTTLEQFLADWAVANLRDDPDFDARYGYRALDPLLPEKVQRIRSAPFETLNTLAQYGIDYIDLRATGLLTVTFAGDTTADLLPLPPTGQLAWFAPSGTDTAPHLTRRFDLRTVDAATLEFWLWYDLEQDYDYAYVQASQDGGQTWTLLESALMDAGVYGPAYSGRSADVRGARDGWLRDAIPLDAYAGGELLLRFAVLNDGAYVERGFAVDGIAIPEIGYVGDADDAQAAAWQAAGFWVTGARLPQQWALVLVQEERVLPIALDAFNRARWVVDTRGAPATLVVMPQTPGPVEGASYWLQIDAP